VVALLRLVFMAVLAVLFCSCFVGDGSVLYAARVKPAVPGAGAREAGSTEADPHAKVLAQQYPSATDCGFCHQQIYDEWKSSNHAYASISPMFHKFEQKINDLSQGTVGYFCMRCHGSVGTTMKERRDLPLWERADVSREGVTCITCHRVAETYQKVNGERRIEPGDITNPVYGPLSGEGVASVAGDLKGTIHEKGVHFQQISESEFCVSCHQVAVHPGIKLEIVWDQYRAAPAAKNTTCQECHMGAVPGVKSGYPSGPAVQDIEVPGRKEVPKHHNHAFYGPGYPIAHPGIFPHNLHGADLKVKGAPEGEWPAVTTQDWLKFDYRAGWGTPLFEERVKAGQVQVAFPSMWSHPDKRRAAALVIDENVEELKKKRELRRKVMENGSEVLGPVFHDGSVRAGQPLRFHYTVVNKNPGHNLPSGSLGAQPELWLNVCLIDPDGNNVWESGYVDKNGDVCDLHSLEVAKGRIPHDDQLFNLQTKFLTTNVKGTDREVYLPVNMDIDQIPFIRPAGNPISVMNHPPFIRMESRSLPPLATRDAKYTVPGRLLKKPGKYTLWVRMRSRAEPIYFMRFVGATEEMERRMNEWILDYHVSSKEIEVR